MKGMWDKISLHDWPASWRYWRWPVCVSLVAVVFQAGGWAMALRYSPVMIEHGQWWRVLSAQFIHLSWFHLGRDVLALAMIWFGFGTYLSERGWIVLFVWNALVICTGLYLFDPALQWYEGLSGVLYGYLVCAGLLQWATRPWLGAVVVSGTALFALSGVIFGPLPGQDVGLGGPVIPMAHLLGVLGGFSFMAARRIWIGFVSNLSPRMV